MLSYQVSVIPNQHSDTNTLSLSPAITKTNLHLVIANTAYTQTVYYSLMKTLQELIQQTQIQNDA